MARYFRPQSLDLYQKIGTPIPTSQIHSSRFSQDETYLTGVKESQSPSPEKLPNPFYYPNKPRAPSSVSFDKQTSRPASMSLTPVHPMRFIKFQDAPLVYSNVRRIPTPSLKLTPGRSFSGQKDLSDQPEYYPNYTMVEKQAPKVIFSKMLGRPRPKAKAKSVSPPKQLVYQVLDRNTPCPSLERNSARPVHKTLPSFMMRQTHRNGLCSLSFKGLEMNGYCYRDFLNTNSVFGNLSGPEKIYATPIQGRCPKIVKLIKKKLKVN